MAAIPAEPRGAVEEPLLAIAAGGGTGVRVEPGRSSGVAISGGALIASQARSSDTQPSTTSAARARCEESTRVRITT
jgi:hypothetical protein